MASPKRKKVWRVRREFVGRVAIESQLKSVVLSDSLSDSELLALSKKPNAKPFLEQIYVTIVQNEG